MNNIDYSIIAILMLTSLYGYMKGFILAVYSMLSTFIAIGITYYVYPYVTEFVMKQTSYYETLQEKISETLNIQEIFGSLTTKESQIDAVNNLEIPSLVKMVITNNANDDIYEILGVTTFENYMSSLIATLAINAVVFIVVLIAVMLIISFLVRILDLISKLPFLNITNRVGGILVGLFIGIVFISIAFMGVTAYISVNNNIELYNNIQESEIGWFFLDSNPIMQIVNSADADGHFWETLTTNLDSVFPTGD